MLWCEGGRAMVAHANAVVSILLACLWSMAAPSLAIQQDEPRAAGADVEVYSESTVGVVGRTRVIAFRVAEASPNDRVLDATADPSVLEIVRAPEVLAGETIGFLRVRGAATGSTSLTIGDASMKVVVREDERSFAIEHTPRIVGPATGAVAWGTIGVGVEIFEPDSWSSLYLELPDGALIAPTRESRPRQGPWHKASFEVDLDGVVGDAVALLPVAIDADGERIAGDQVSVHVARPDSADLHFGEAEAEYGVEQPRRFASNQRSVGRDRDASGGAFFSNAGPIPAVCFPIDVESDGSYQVVVRASGSLAGGALPTVSIYVDGADQPVTNGRTISPEWHRVVVGVPFTLSGGRHVITPYFANDFYVPGRADRNLRLDCIEVLRVGDADGSARASTMMMQQTAMMSGGPMKMMGDDAMTRMAMSAPTSGSMTTDPLGTRSMALRIGLDRPLDGRPIAGDLLVKGYCWWQDAERGTPPPRVSLVVNGEPIGIQRTGSPQFIVDSAWFVPGDNTIQLVARLESGEVGATPVQTLSYVPEAAAREAPARRYRRFSIHEPEWDDATRERFREGHWPAERVSAALMSNGSIRLALPEEMAGEFDALLEVRGDDFDGPARVEVALEVAGERAPIFEQDVPVWWGPHAGVSPIALARGEKTLVLSFINDLYEPDRGDRNLWVQSVALTERRRDEDRKAPIVDLRYPSDDQAMCMADAIVASVTDDCGVTWVEVLVDDVPTGVSADLTRQPGDLCLPLVLRGVSPGEHTVALRAYDAARNVGWSEVRRVRVLEAAPAEPTQYERAVRLLNRFAFGPDPAQLGAILTMGEEAWLRQSLERPVDDAGDLAAFGSGLAFFPIRRDAYQASAREIQHALLTPNPVRARFIQWSDNHFSTWIRKVEGDRKWDEHAAFSRLGPARFQDLLATSAHSPAMLRYLDQDTSFDGAINENYAREIMELHTLGADAGYTQEDVTTLARLLTGWTASTEGDGHSPGESREFTFRFDPALSGDDECRIIGMRFPDAGPEERCDRIRLLIETLAAHPGAPEFVCRSLAEHYTSVPAPDELVEDLADTYRTSGGDMKAVLISLASHPAFFDDDAARVAQPVDYALRLGRTTGFINPWQIAEFLNRSGAGLFDRSTPDGYPEEDAAYTDSNALVQRWRLAKEANWSLSSVVPGVWNWGSPTISDEDWAQLVVDAISVRLTGSVLSDASNEAAVKLLLDAEGTRAERSFTIAPIIAQMPEASLR